MDNITGFAVVGSSEDAEAKLKSLLKFESETVEGKFVEGGVNPSEFILAEVLGFNVEYVVDTVDGLRSFYTIRNKDFVHKGWVTYMNMFYSAGVSCAGLNCFVEAMNVWFDVQGESGSKGWLSRFETDADVASVWGLLSDNDEALLGLHGFSKPAVVQN